MTKNRIFESPTLSTIQLLQTEGQCWTSHFKYMYTNFAIITDRHMTFLLKTRVSLREE